MSDQNQCNFTGRLGADPESRSMTNGDPVCNFSIAVSSKWNDKNTGEKKEKTVWVRIVTFRGLAGVCSKFLQKGSHVRITGQHSVSKWQDDKGNNRESVEIIASEMQMLGGKPGGSTGNAAAPAKKFTPVAPTGNGGAGPDINFDDEIPFMRFEY